MARSPASRSKSGHARVKTKSDGNGAGVLLVANDAALSNQYERAEKLLTQGAQRAIATAYQIVTPESAESGDVAEQGWKDEDGADIEVNADDIEEEVEAGSHAPVTDAIVKKAVQWLRGEGAIETSSTSYHQGVWYSTEFETDYSTGGESSEDFFLRNFTPAEEKLVFEQFTRRR